MQLEHRLLALLQLHLHSRLSIWHQYIAQRQLQGETRNILFLIFDTRLILEIWRYIDLVRIYYSKTHKRDP